MEDGAKASLVLPHNSALVMWDDAQEGWLHSVPRCANSSIGRHPLTGLERISLTFRHTIPGADKSAHVRWTQKRKAEAAAAEDEEAAKQSRAE